MADYISPIFNTGEEVDEALSAGLEALEGLKSKQDTLTASQLSAVNSGITEATVTQIGTNKTSISSLQSGKVDKVSGKQLSTNDFTTAEKTKLAGLSNYDDTDIQADLSQLQGKVVENRAALAGIIDSGAKNKLSWSTAGKVHNGITFTVNGDGTVTVSGTNNGSANSFISLKVMTAAEIGAMAGCILSGTPENSVGAYLSLEERGGSYTTYIRDRGEGIEIPTISTEVNVYVVVPRNATVTDMIFKPMICTAAEWDISEEFQPHRPSYQELYERILALEGGGTASLSMASPQASSLDTEERSDM